ncbi:MULTISPECIES: dihydrolipoamide acetyltransferase family protein [unclassified Thermosynechococcus]|uniref:dihydrolipoamide acetyltransferase family protein n=1 Tax=unclassified Thermosynechococcus TaxID=2622553 RepID=UPI002872B995|nr:MULTISPECIES: dihydrolipoamide acetyltransferase family protein [unclassified Thermosynechococcus]WNC33085.1 dihydrolipoamide acetyltransferase family protein [Thermosynechococcus sp. PKX95]WNC35611.1 dihydrolipoamide acetyltransferase family protein [Thermosynechococcus sp. PKX91]WNC38133.1 dihydrolipoamide acetyltransferase family protein [Thermosynechococcus sp. WL11]WNC40653.1 dihydrolipoamide acetyltransferase family protein [Thermosynechococcus sp. WL17]WNC43173.1 dihydrolipoamide ace
MIRELFMPALSSTMTEGKIVSWVKSPGDKVAKGETVLIVESDKADMDVESFYDGYLAVITVPAGEVAPVGSTIGLVAETEAEIAEAEAKAKSLGAVTSSTTSSAATASTPAAATSNGSATAPVAVASPTSAVAATTGRVIASPRARKLAKEHKIDLQTLKGTGPNGRITAADVEALIGAPATPVTPVATPPVPTAAAATAPVVAKEDLVPLTTLQNAVVRNMVASLGIPDFHVAYTITTDALDRLYQQIKSKGVTMTALLAKAIALTLQKHPIMNAYYTEQGIQYRRDINIAVAVAMPGGGLITPVLKNADQIDIYSLSRTWKDLVERARAKQLQPEEYSTGTFSLSNLGMFGVDFFDAILTPGQGAIMAVGASRPTVVATEDGLLGVKRQMKVNITCDHRVIYGADAAAFLQDLAKLIETNPQALTL